MNEDAGSIHIQLFPVYLSILLLLAMADFGQDFQSLRASPLPAVSAARHMIRVFLSRDAFRLLIENLVQGWVDWPLLQLAGSLSSEQQQNIGI